MQDPVPINAENSSRKSNMQYFKRKLSKQKYLQAMALPGVIWMLMFCYIPLYFIIIAFKEYDVVLPISKAPWVGFEHFVEFFTDDRFWMIIRNTFGISFFRLLIGFPVPIIFALMLNELTSIKFKRVVQTISYLPHFLSWVILGGIVMAWVSETGIITQMLATLKIIPEQTLILAEPGYFWQVAVISDIWKELGWSAILYIAAIAGIDQSLYESAIVDGAGRFRRMWSITLPSIKGTITVLFILAAGSLMNTNFDQIMVLKNTLNNSASSVIDIFVYQMGIQSGRFSFSTAVGLFRSVISLVILFAANSVTRKLTDSSLF